jgi:uncharacterized protein (DUF2267 family)
MDHETTNLEVGPEPLPAEQSARVLFHDLEQSGALPEGISAEDAASAVLCTLTRRLSGGEARDFAHAGPPAVRPFLIRCTRHRDEHSETFDRNTFLRYVAEHLGIDTDAADRLSRAVFAAAQKQMPPKEVDDAASQLPDELRELWKG